MIASFKNYLTSLIPEVSDLLPMAFLEPSFDDYPSPLPVAYETIETAAEAAQKFQEASDRSSPESGVASSPSEPKRRRIRKKKSPEPKKAETDARALPPTPVKKPNAFPKSHSCAADFIPNYLKESEKESIKENTPPRREEKPFLFMNHNYLSITFSNGQLNHLFHQALDLFECGKGFIPSQNPHITIATELEIEGKGLSPAQRRLISNYYKHEVHDYSFAPLQLRRLVRQPTPLDPIQELLVVEVEPSRDIQKFRKWLRDDAKILCQDAGDAPKHQLFHITLGARTLSPEEQVNQASLRHRKIITLDTISLP